jgi:hypothetical protein
MTKPESHYKQYLARKRQKQQTSNSLPARRREPMAWQMQWITHAPIHECLVPASLFEQGLGNLVFSRALPDGHIAISVFLLDMFCLGVKNAFFTIATKAEYRARLTRIATSQELQPLDPSSFRKLVEGGVAYARELGFHPHADYSMACQIFGNIDAAACKTNFEYGHEGRPLYISGPHESAARVQAILDQLERHLGPDNFHFLVAADGPGVMT